MRVDGLDAHGLYVERMNAPLPADRLDLLHTLVHIVDAGSLSAAARLLGTTQPTVSRRLQQLERLLGARLLQRSTHGMKLTEDGERCCDHARDLLERWQSLATELRGTQDEPRGMLRVRVPTVFGQQRLVAPLVGLLDRHPDLSVEWHLSDRLPDFIAEGVDCAVHIGAVDAPGLVALRVAELPRIVVAAPGVWGEGPVPQTPAELARLPWLALDTFYRDEVTLHPADAGPPQRFAIRPRLSTDHLQALCNAALAGLGACIASRWAVVEALDAGRLVQLAPRWTAPALPILLVHPPLRHPPARLRAFVQRMRDDLPRMPGVRPPGAETQSLGR